MAQERSVLKICPREAERVWDWKGIPVLRASLSLPAPDQEDRSPAARRLERFYRAQGQAFLRRCETFLLPQALFAAQAALDASRPLPCLEAALTHRITLETDDVLSLHTDLRELGVEQTPYLCRWGDTWDLASGFLLPLSAWYPPGVSWKRLAVKSARKAAEARQKAGAARYREGWQKFLRRSFDPRSYYLTQDGLALFWPQYALAPGGDGISVLVLPYDPDGPLAPSLPQA